MLSLNAGCVRAEIIVTTLKTEQRCRESRTPLRGRAGGGLRRGVRRARVRKVRAPEHCKGHRGGQTAASRHRAGRVLIGICIIGQNGGFWWGHPAARPRGARVPPRRLPPLSRAPPRCAERYCSRAEPTHLRGRAWGGGAGGQRRGHSPARNSRRQASGQP